MLLEISVFPIIIILVLLALPVSNSYTRLKETFSFIILFILIRLVPLNSSVFSLTPLVAARSIILWVTSILKRFVPYNYSHAYYVPTRVPYPLIPVLYFLELVSDLVRPMALTVPYPLIPVLYFLELVSDLVRPMALTVRIVVNLSLRHLFIHRSARAALRLFIPIILVFELAVAFIQRFIYSSLPSL